MTRRSTPTHPGSLRQSAYETLLSAIIYGDLAPGSSMDEKQISETFALGIASVRDALLRLALEKMVDRHPRIGTLIPPLGIRDVQDVFEARILLEGECAALAAERASPAEIGVLRDSFSGFKNVIAKRDFRTLVRMDQLERELILLHNNASRFWYFGIQRLNPKALTQDIEAHVFVANAIASRNAQAAKTCMQDLLEHFPEHMSGLLVAAPMLDRKRAKSAAVTRKLTARRRAAVGA
jgi:GntR family transcriptional regulator, rspAB operon transcriptional repressor